MSNGDPIDFDFLSRNSGDFSGRSPISCTRRTFVGSNSRAESLALFLELFLRHLKEQYFASLERETKAPPQWLQFTHKACPDIVRFPLREFYLARDQALTSIK